MDASRMLSLVHAAQLERERQVLRGYDSAHDSGHTAGEWIAMVQQYVEELRDRTEQDARMERQYGDAEDWPDGVVEQYDWPDTAEAAIKLMAVLFAWNDRYNWITPEIIDEYAGKKERARDRHG